MKRKNYLPFLEENNIDIRDFHRMISQGDAEMNREKTMVVQYYGVSLEYNKSGELIDIYPSDGFADGMADGVISRILDVLSPDAQEQRIRSSFFFSPYRVQGCFEIPGLLKIRPVPEGYSTHTGEEFADHPFLLEYFYSMSPNGILNNDRASRRSHELGMLLDLLLNGYVKPNLGKEKKWVMIREKSEVLAFHSEWLRPGYIGDGEGLPIDDKEFMPFECLTLDTQPLYDYYQFQNGIRYGAGLIIPDNLEESFSIYFSLTKKEQELFLRALYWYATAGTIQNQSLSSAFVSLVNAIECFVETNFLNKCQECKQDVYDKSISSAFKEFLDNYTYGIDNKTKNEFYSLRSALAHGHKIMPQDDFNARHSFTPYHYYSSNTFRLFRYVVKIVLNNWLHSHG